MKLDKLFEIQKELDRQIIEGHQLEGQDLLPKKLLALKVELGELANETRCFKFWSFKPSSRRENILEEFVDCIHFILSIANEIRFFIEKYDFAPYILDPDDIVEQFNTCFYAINLTEDRDFEDESIEYLIESFLGLGNMLGFSSDEIVSAYLQKNKVNHERLASGY